MKKILITNKQNLESPEGLEIVKFSKPDCCLDLQNDGFVYYETNFIDQQEFTLNPGESQNFAQGFSVFDFDSAKFLLLQKSLEIDLNLGYVIRLTKKHNCDVVVFQTKTPIFRYLDGILIVGLVSAADKRRKNSFSALVHVEAGEFKFANLKQHSKLGSNNQSIQTALVQTVVAPAQENRRLSTLKQVRSPDLLEDANSTYYPRYEYLLSATVATANTSLVKFHWPYIKNNPDKKGLPQRLLHSDPEMTPRLKYGHKSINPEDYERILERLVAEYEANQVVDEPIENFSDDVLSIAPESSLLSQSREETDGADVAPSNAYKMADFDEVDDYDLDFDKESDIDQLLNLDNSVPRSQVDESETEQDSVAQEEQTEVVETPQATPVDTQDSMGNQEVVETLETMDYPTNDIVDGLVTEDSNLSIEGFDDPLLGEEIALSDSEEVGVDSVEKDLVDEMPQPVFGADEFVVLDNEVDTVLTLEDEPDVKVVDQVVENDTNQQSVLNDEAVSIDREVDSLLLEADEDDGGVVEAMSQPEEVVIPKTSFFQRFRSWFGRNKKSESVDSEDVGQTGFNDILEVNDQERDQDQADNRLFIEDVVKPLEDSNDPVEAVVDLENEGYVLSLDDTDTNSVPLDDGQTVEQTVVGFNSEESTPPSYQSYDDEALTLFLNDHDAIDDLDESNQLQNEDFKEEAGESAADELLTTGPLFEEVNVPEELTQSFQETEPDFTPANDESELGQTTNVKESELTVDSGDDLEQVFEVVDLSEPDQEAVETPNSDPIYEVDFDVSLDEQVKADKTEVLETVQQSDELAHNSLEQIPQSRNGSEPKISMWERICQLWRKESKSSNTYVSLDDDAIKPNLAVDTDVISDNYESVPSGVTEPIAVEHNVLNGPLEREVISNPVLVEDGDDLVSVQEELLTNQQNQLSQFKREFEIAKDDLVAPESVLEEPTETLNITEALATEQFEEVNQDLTQNEGPKTELIDPNVLVERGDVLKELSLNFDYCEKVLNDFSQTAYSCLSLTNLPSLWTQYQSQRVAKWRDRANKKLIDVPVKKQMRADGSFIFSNEKVDLLNEQLDKFIEKFLNKNIRLLQLLRDHKFAQSSYSESDDKQRSINELEVELAEFLAKKAAKLEVQNSL